MRAIMLAVAACSVGTVEAFAAEQFTINFPAGYTLFSVPLDNGSSNSYQTLFAGAPTGTRIYKWNGTSYDISLKAGGNWSPPGFLKPGEGAWLVARSNLAVTFTGTPVAVTAMNINPTNIYLLGSQRYETNTARFTYEDITGEAPKEGITLLKWKGKDISDPMIVPENWAFYRFKGGAWVPGVPKLGAGEAAFVGRVVPGAIEGSVFTSNAQCARGEPIANWPIRLQNVDTGERRYTFTGRDGVYRFLVGPGNYRISQETLSLEAVRCFGQACPDEPSFYSVTVAQGDIVSGKDFGNVLVQDKPELWVGVYVPWAQRAPCCGHEHSYHLVYHSLCAVPFGAELEFVMPDLVSYVSHESDPVIPFGDFRRDGKTFTWKIPPLQFGTSGRVYFKVKVDDCPTNQPDWAPTLVATATIKPVATDLTPRDNIDQMRSKVSCAFDPNDKEVDPKGCGPAGLVGATQPLTYTIHFQNVGSGPAFDVVVRDVLDGNLDLSTLEILGASHNFVLETNAAEVTWIFPDIQLPAAIEDEPGSRGFLRFRVRPVAGLAEGAVITNQAAIYFDLNPPILTSVTTNTLTLGILPEAQFVVMPHPGSAGHTIDFFYTGGTPGGEFFWNFGPDAMPPTSAEMNPSGIMFGSEGLRSVSLQVSVAGCEAGPETSLFRVGRPVLQAGVFGGKVCLSWEGEGYDVQQAGSIQAPAVWHPVQEPVNQIGATHFVWVDPTNGFRCYRLSD